jgi:acyl-CoA thioester hydrolase
VAERLNAAALKAVDPVLRIRGFESHPLRSMSFVHRHRVRYHECDAQGRVFNAHYFAYFDIALTELWREAFGSYQQMVDEGYDVVVADAGARFRGAAQFDDEIDIEMTIAELGQTSMTTDIQVRREGDVLVEGRIVHVWVDARTYEKISIPDVARDRLSAFS